LHEKTPLHEAARSGHVEVASYLLSQGLDINQRTHDGSGGSVLFWAKKAYRKDSPIQKYLKNNGAVEIAPE
jgi:ankyrin repeat protein